MDRNHRGFLKVVFSIFGSLGEMLVMMSARCEARAGSNSELDQS